VQDLFFKSDKNSKWCFQWQQKLGIDLHILGLTKLRRDHIAFFGITNKKSVPGVCAFKRVIKKFQTYGSVDDERTNNKRPNSVGDGNVRKIQNYLFENPKSSTRKASSNLKISKSSIHKTLKKTLKFKPYRSTCRP